MEDGRWRIASPVRAIRYSQSSIFSFSASPASWRFHFFLPIGQPRLTGLRRSPQPGTMERAVDSLFEVDLAMIGVLAQFQSLDATTRWMLIGAASLTILYAVMRPLRRKKDPLARPPLSSLSAQRSVEREMTALLVELSEMSRQITAQLDTRATKLELLIKQADERLAELKSATAARPAMPRAGEVGIESSGDDATRERCTPALDPRHAEVYRLADEGRSSRQIAQQLGRPDGEVELILALRGTR